MVEDVAALPILLLILACLVQVVASGFLGDRFAIRTGANRVASVIVAGLLPWVGLILPLLMAKAENTKNRAGNQRFTSTIAALVYGVSALLLFVGVSKTWITIKAKADATSISEQARSATGVDIPAEASNALAATDKVWSFTPTDSLLLTAFFVGLGCLAVLFAVLMSTKGGLRFSAPSYILAANLVSLLMATIAAQILAYKVGELITDTTSKIANVAVFFGPGTFLTLASGVLGLLAAIAAVNRSTFGVPTAVATPQVAPPATPAPGNAGPQRPPATFDDDW